MMHRRYWQLVILYCGLIFILSSIPGTAYPEKSFPAEDKVVHIVLYGILAGLISRGMHCSGKTIPGWKMIVIPAVFASLYGGTDELHQLFVPYRSCEWGDFFADMGGGILFSVILYKVWPFFKTTNLEEHVKN